MTSWRLLTFREKCSSLNEDDVIQVKEAFKWVMQGLVAKELGGVAVVTRVKSRWFRSWVRSSLTWSLSLS